MAKTAVIVAFEVKEGQIDPFLDIIRAHAARTLAVEPGCERFDILIPTDGSAAVNLHEVYADDAAFFGTQAISAPRRCARKLSGPNPWPDFVHLQLRKLSGCFLVAEAGPPLEPSPAPNGRMAGGEGRVRGATAALHTLQDEVGVTSLAAKICQSRHLPPSL